MGVVLRGGAEHGRAADIDLLDRLLPRGAGSRDRVLERVEVHADEVERRDTVPLEVDEVLGHVAAGEDAAVYGRVQGHDTVTEHVGEAGELLDRRHLEPCVGQEPRRAAARHELDAEPVEPFRERGQARLVPRGQERPLHAMSSRHHLGQQAVLDRLDPGVQGLRCVAGKHRDRLLAQHRACIDPLVDEVHGGTGLGDAGSERVLDGMDARERRQERGVHVDDAAREAVEEARCEQMHVACADNEIDTVQAKPARHVGVACLAVGIAGEREGGGREPGALGALERARAGDVGGDRSDGQAGVEQRLEVRALPAGEHAYASAHATPSIPGSMRPIDEGRRPPRRTPPRRRSSRCRG